MTVHDEGKVLLNLVVAGGALAVIAVATVGPHPKPKPEPPVVTVPPVVTIIGSAHPLGGVDVGIPCNSLVYTRC